MASSQIRQKPSPSAPMRSRADWPLPCRLIAAALCFALADGALFKPLSNVDCRHLAGSTDQLFAVTFDAGSSGTRMHVFRFNVRFPRTTTPDTRQLPRIDLLEEVYRRSEPGLSSFADKPEKAARSLRWMLDEANAIIPKGKTPCTNLALKATAGLRLLTDEQARAILTKITSLFTRYSFHLNPNPAIIMDGPHEGYYSWLMVAFVLKRSFTSNNLATLDLGGASTQVTFIPDERSTLARRRHIHEFLVPGASIRQKIYSHSYLGGGIFFARTKILLLSTVPPPQPVTYRPPRNDRVVASPCIHPDSAGSSGLIWSYMNRNYTVKAATDFNGFYACYAKAKEYVTARLKVFSPKELSDSKRKIFAMSAYFYRARDAGLIGKSALNGTVTVADFEQSARKECLKNGESRKGNEYLCLDLCYITALLKEGYALRNKEKLQVVKQIGVSEVSWALGASLAELDLRTKQTA